MISHNSTRKKQSFGYLIYNLFLGFPLQKAVEYIKLHQPFLINDIKVQFAIQDRREVYQILQENNIETPRYAVCDHVSGKGLYIN